MSWLEDWLDGRVTICGDKMGAPDLAFAVNGPPVGYQRVGSKTGRMFTPKKTREYMAHAGGCAQLAAWNYFSQSMEWPTQEWVYLDLAIYCARTRNGRWPDGTNVAKSIEDGCAGILWADAKGNPDDKKVLTRIQRLVPMDDHPRVEVAITRVSKLRSEP